MVEQSYGPSGSWEEERWRSQYSDSSFKGESPVTYFLQLGSTS